MVHSNRLLIALFVILLVFVVGEIIYFFFILPSQEKKKISLPASNQTTTALPSPQSQFTPPVTNNAIAYINRVDKRHLTSSKLINIYEGIILEVGEKTGAITDPAYNTTYTYSHILSIKTKDAVTPLTFHYGKADFERMVVLDSSGKPIDFETLKPNETILVEETINTMSDDYHSLFSYKITKR